MSIEDRERRSITLAVLFDMARGLKSEDGENKEYDRALIELCCDAAGYSMDEKYIVAERLQIPGYPIPERAKKRQMIDRYEGLGEVMNRLHDYCGVSWEGTGTLSGHGALIALRGNMWPPGDPNGQPLGGDQRLALGDFLEICINAGDMDLCV